MSILIKTEKMNSVEFSTANHVVSRLPNTAVGVPDEAGPPRRRAARRSFRRLRSTRERCASSIWKHPTRVNGQSLSR